ncbi:MAG: hypothetical protein ACJAWW_001802 [Sulfurimonas sp.]|jgi:hypothetical protein
MVFISVFSIISKSFSIVLEYIFAPQKVRYRAFTLIGSMLIADTLASAEKVYGL